MFRHLRPKEIDFKTVIEGVIDLLLSLTPLEKKKLAFHLEAMRTLRLLLFEKSTKLLPVLQDLMLGLERSIQKIRKTTAVNATIQTTTSSVGIGSGIGGFFFPPLWGITIGTAITNIVASVVSGSKIRKSSKLFEQQVASFQEMI